VVLGHDSLAPVVHHKRTAPGLDGDRRRDAVSVHFEELDAVGRNRSQWDGLVEKEKPDQVGEPIVSESAALD